MFPESAFFISPFRSIRDDFGIKGETVDCPDTADVATNVQPSTKNAKMTLRILVFFLPRERTKIRDDHEATGTTPSIKLFPFETPPRSCTNPRQIPEQGPLSSGDAPSGAAT